MIKKIIATDETQKVNIQRETFVESARFKYNCHDKSVNQLVNTDIRQDNVNISNP